MKMRKIKKRYIHSVLPRCQEEQPSGGEAQQGDHPKAGPGLLGGWDGGSDRLDFNRRGGGLDGDGGLLDRLIGGDRGDNCGGRHRSHHSGGDRFDGGLATDTGIDVTTA